MLRKKDGFQGQKTVVIPRNILQRTCAKDAATAPLYITDIGYYPKARFHHRRRVNGADQHILIYCQEGKGSITVKKNAWLIQPGDCFIIPRRWPHEYSADEQDPWTIYWAHFTGDTAEALVAAAQQQWKGHKIFLPHAESRLELFDNIYQQLENGYYHEHLIYANMNFWAFLASCIYPDIYHSGKGGKEHTTVDKAIDFMNKQLHRMLTLQEMAQSVNLSTSHFSLLFRTGTGFSPMEYFNHLKVQEACKYLLFTSLRVKEIAARLGMQDPYYFSRLFSKVMGMSPNQYREQKEGS